MTSNLGSDLILEAGEEEAKNKASPSVRGKGKNKDSLKDLLMELLKQSFRPEFLNRIDETVIFNRLGRAEIGKIVDIQLARLMARLGERKIELKLTDAAKEVLAERGYDPLFGARPLKRTIQQDLENPLAKAIISGRIKEGDIVTADKGGGSGGEALLFKKKGESAKP
jgi:ATP-dependent Clp protease ATP-binding subunit ClpB